MHAHTVLNVTDPTRKISTMRDVHRRGIESDTDSDMNDDKKKENHTYVSAGH